MFLTKECWRTNNPVVQAIAHPDTAWDAVFFGLTQATFVVRVRQRETTDPIDTNWLLLARPETLLHLMTSAQVRVEDVMALLPPQESNMGQWACERMTSITEKTDQHGIIHEYSTEHRSLSTRPVHGAAAVTYSYAWGEHGWCALVH
nr:hypothetical protein [uncultured Pseudogulbenkiania sp.]